MRLSSIKSPEKRAKFVSHWSKRLASPFRAATQTVPVFVTGMQRSGTTMLMNTFQLHEHAQVHDEAADSHVFDDYRIRDMQTLEKSIERSKYPFVCYKIISDSHILTDFLARFPTSRVLWAYRSATDNADSQLKKFPHATRAIKLVCEDKPGGGWFAEGCSEATVNTLRGLDRSAFSEFDYACLVWWARNILYFEGEHEHHPRVRLLQYEETARDPHAMMRSVQNWIGIPVSQGAARFVHARSVAKKDLPPLDEHVARLCSDLEARMNTLCKQQWADDAATANR
ncbi:MAG: sulfotransferase [Pseudomonadota bacterium]